MVPKLITTPGPTSQFNVAVRPATLLLHFAIPKFHISVHGLNCQSNFSFNYQPYMACTDGEDLEHWWAHINPMSMSMKEMGPRAQLDTLDDYAGAWNWWKITGFGEHFKLVIDRFSTLNLFYIH